MLGEGIVSFGVRVTTDFKNLKASTKMGLGRVTRLVIARSGRVKWRSPPLPWNVTGIVWPWLDQPSSWSRKSMCHDLRRCSPSVMPCSPTSSWSFTTSRMEASSAAASLSAPTRPASFSSLSALSAAGRRRLPTWSARNGPRAAAVISLFEVPAEEGQHLLPRVFRGGGPRHGPPHPPAFGAPRGTRGAPRHRRHHFLRCRPRKRSEEHTSELQSLAYLVCRLLLEKKKKKRGAKLQEVAV